MTATTLSTTLRPGLLVSLKTSITGNVSYRTKDLDNRELSEAEADEQAQALAARAKAAKEKGEPLLVKRDRWETERTTLDAAEHERAVKARTKARVLIKGVCRESAFGLLCVEADRDLLDKAMADARAVIDEFNATARVTQIHVYMITGRIADNDIEAVRAINSEVRGLIDAMEEGVKNLDAKAIREAATKVKNLGTILSPEAQTRAQMAVDAARAAAKQIVAAGETAGVQIDRQVIRQLTESRTAFLDLDTEGKPVQAPTARGRAVDFTPTEEKAPPPAKQPKARARAAEV